MDKVNEVIDKEVGLVILLKICKKKNILKTTNNFYHFYFKTNEMSKLFISPVKIIITQFSMACLNKVNRLDNFGKYRRMTPEYVYTTLL